MTLSAREISPNTAVPIALITGGTSICGCGATAATFGWAVAGGASARFDRVGVAGVSRTVRVVSIVTSGSTASGWRVFSITTLRSGGWVSAATTSLTNAAACCPGLGRGAVRTFDSDTVARSLPSTALTASVTASWTAALTAFTACIAPTGLRSNAGSASALRESGLFSAGFADCDVLAAPPSSSDSVCANAVPAPASIPTVTPAHTAPAPSHSKNRSPMQSPVC
jgi:hypothetical protein